jgi:hypothetical protein
MTNYRQPAEDVYLCRLTAPASNARRVFLDYMRGINELKERPQFYNTLTTNCTTLTLSHAAVPGTPALQLKGITERPGSEARHALSGL